MANTLFTVLQSTFTAIADAIRDRLHENIALTPLDMPAAIRRIDNGGRLSEITVLPQATGFIEEPAEGYYGIGKATILGDANLVEGNVRRGVEIFGVTGTYEPPVYLQNRTVEITENNTYTIRKTLSYYTGLNQVTMEVAVPTEIIAQEKSVMPGANQKIVTPDAAYNSLSKVTVSGDNNLVPANIKRGVTIFNVTGTYSTGQNFQQKTVSPTGSQFDVRPDSGYDGLTMVRVLGDGYLIPANIRDGVTIYGVTGTYSTGINFQQKTVTPGYNTQQIRADAGYNALSQVIVNGDHDLLPENIKLGVNIFGVNGSLKYEYIPLIVVPSASEQFITPTGDVAGFSSVTVQAANPDIWSGTLQEYHDLGEYDSDTLYAILPDPV